MFSLFRFYLIIICFVVAVAGSSQTSKHVANEQQIKLNVPYVAGGGSDQQLDMYLPATINFKTIMYVHEGGLLSGDKKDEPYEKIALKFQQDGIAVMVINYKLGPNNKWPAQPDDVCSAFAWIKRNIRKYGGDSSKVFIVGHSSGAFLTSLIASDKKYVEKVGFGLNDIAGFISIGTMLKAVYPDVAREKLAALFQNNNYLRIFGDTATFMDAAAINHVNADIPPGLFIIADSEQFQPPILEQTQQFIEKIKPYKRDITYAVIPDRTHRTNITRMIEQNDPVYKLIKNFVSGRVDN